jgi:nucleotide-binding universal stress UspA family protein
LHTALIFVNSQNVSQANTRSTTTNLEFTVSRFQRILVPVDGSETSNKALVAALQIARDDGGQVRLVFVLDEMAYISGYEYSGNLIEIARQGAAKTLENGLAIAKAAGVPSDTKLIDAPGRRLGETVADEAREWTADLVVVGTHGRRGIGRVLLGSGAEQIIRMTPTPVLVIRADEKPAG